VSSPGSSAVWVLLTRHITDIDDFRENREYITVLVYKNDGKRVHYPGGIIEVKSTSFGLFEFSFLQLILRLTLMEFVSIALTICAKSSRIKKVSRDTLW